MSSTREVGVADEQMTDEEREVAEQMGDDTDDGRTGEERTTLADLAESEPDTEPEVEQYTLFGTAARVNAQIKGAGRIAQSMVKIASRQEKLPGQFDMDDVVEVRVTLRIDKVEVAATRDGEGAIKDTKRVHHASIIALDQVGDVDDAFAQVDGRGLSEEELVRRIEALQGELDQVRASA